MTNRRNVIKQSFAIVVGGFFGGESPHLLCYYKGFLQIFRNKNIFQSRFQRDCDNCENPE
jgi:hypothetical protein